MDHVLDEEQQLLGDPRFSEAVALFNRGEWYPCHDGFEAIWHEMQGPVRPLLQGILQIAVAQIHLDRGNLRGATVLMGEGLGRLAGGGDQLCGLDLHPLRDAARVRLQRLQSGGSASDLAELPPLNLRPIQGSGQRL